MQIQNLHKMRISRSKINGQRAITGLETSHRADRLRGRHCGVRLCSPVHRPVLQRQIERDHQRVGLAETQGTLKLRGAVITEASTTGSAGVVSRITFQVADASGGDAVDLIPGETVIKCVDTA